MSSRVATAVLAIAALLSVAAIVFGGLGLSGFLDYGHPPAPPQDTEGDGSRGGVGFVPPFKNSGEVLGRQQNGQQQKQQQQQQLKRVHQPMPARLTWGTPKQDKQLFVLVSLQRSGSRWAISNIKSHPAIWMKYFEPLSYKTQIQQFGNSSVNSSTSDGDSKRNIRCVRSRPVVAAACHALGFQHSSECIGVGETQPR